MKRTFALSVLAVTLGALCVMARSFEVGEKDFLLDGKPFVVRCGEVHYARIPRAHLRSEATTLFSNITPCSAARGVLNYRRFRELMPSVGLYSESRPDGTHDWSAWDPLGPGSEIHR